jgi:predicted flap endonuclease-1-like 5' DNA nuclease/cell division protein FtsB
MFLLSQSILIVLVSAVIGAFLARVFNLCTCNTEELQEELRVVRENRDELKRQITVGAGSALTDAIGTRKAAVLEAELAEVRSRADELAAANAKLRDGDGVDEDVAALKWRNKYLEARVLFFEGRDTGGSVETPPMPEHMTTAKLVQETEPAPVAFVSAAEEPAKRGRKKSVVVPAPVLEPMVEPVTEPEVVAAPIVKKRKVKAVAPPPPPAEPISNQNFTPSPLAGLSAEALEEAIALAGAGKAAPRSRRRANPDELLLIDGVGPKNKAWLNDQGIYYFYQIATMDIDQVAWLSKNLPTFGARVYRENWVAQCTKLARGEPAR